MGYTTNHKGHKIVHEKANLFRGEIKCKKSNINMNTEWIEFIKKCSLLLKFSKVIKNELLNLVSCET